MNPIEKQMKIMNRIVTITFLTLMLCCFAAPCFAGDFNGSRPMLCATIKAAQCTPAKGCEDVSLEDVGLPRFAVIDVEKKEIHPARTTGVKRVSPIERVESVEGKLILQGAEEGVEGVRDGLGWTIAIGEDSGELVLTASGEGVAFIVFGACTISQ